MEDGDIMTTLIKPDGSYHFIGESETARIAELIAAGAVVMGANGRSIISESLGISVNVDEALSSYADGINKDAPSLSDDEKMQAVLDAVLTKPVTNDAPDVSVMSVRDIKSWLETSPAVADAIDAFKQEQGNKHRKTALDSLQDYIRIDNG